MNTFKKVVTITIKNKRKIMLLKQRLQSYHSLRRKLQKRKRFYVYWKIGSNEAEIKKIKNEINQVWESDYYSILILRLNYGKPLCSTSSGQIQSCNGYCVQNFVIILWTVTTIIRQESLD